MSRPSLLERLKQSHAVQAVGLFLGASWVTLQVVDLMQDRLGLPEWIFPLTSILLLVGFLVVLATAWVQSKPSTTRAEEAGEIPTDWEIDAADVVASLKEGRLPHLTWARAVLGGVIALSFVFGSAAAYVLVRGGAVPFVAQEAGADETTAGIAVLPFEVNNPELELWREGIVDLLSTGLDGVAGYRTVSSRTVLSRWGEEIGDASPDLPRTLSVAGGTGARYALTGNVVALGPSVRLSAEVYDLANGSKVADGRAEGPADSVLVLVDRLGLSALRSLLGAVGGEAVDVARLPSVTTTSLTAMRAFLEGEALFRRGDFPAALTAYRKAIAEDSTFALPVYRATQAYGWIESHEGEEELDRRLNRVLPLLPERDRVLARLSLQLAGDSLQSIAPAENAVQTYPDDPEAWYMLGEVRYHESGLAGGGMAPAREAFERALALSPDFVPYHYHAIEYAIGMGDRARSEELLASLQSLAPTDPRTEAYRQAGDLLFGDLTEARARMRSDWQELFPQVLSVQLAPSMVSRVSALLSEIPSEGAPQLADLKSTFAMAAGRQAEAIRLLETIPRGSRRRVTLARHHQDLIGVLPGLDPDAEYRSEACGDPGHPSTGCSEKVALHAVDAGRMEEARAAVASQDDLARGGGSEDPEARPQHLTIHRRIARTVEGYMAWKRGDLPGALEALRQARREDRFAVTARWILAEVLVEAGEPAEALDLYLSIDNSPTWSPFSRLKAGQVLERMGDRERAAELYRSALGAWVGADQGFEPKAEAEAGLARTGG